MMQPIDARHMVVDRTSYAEVAGAQSVDVDANSVLVVRKKGWSNEDERVTLYFPAGVVVVRRR
jgi:hypothetical protein